MQQVSRGTNVPASSSSFSYACETLGLCPGGAQTRLPALRRPIKDGLAPAGGPNSARGSWPARRVDLMDVNVTRGHGGAPAPRLPGNGSREDEDLDVNTDVYSKVAVTLIYAAVFAVGALGNSLTLHLLLRRRSGHSLQGAVHQHLLSLAVSDLLVLLLCMPVELHSFVWFHHPWLFGDAACRAYYFLRDGCSYATVLNICSLSVERYLAVCHPLAAKSLVSASRAKKLIGATWLAAFALAAPMMLVMGQKSRNGEKICTAVVSPRALRSVLQVGLVCVSQMCVLRALHTCRFLGRVR